MTMRTVFLLFGGLALAIATGCISSRVSSGSSAAVTPNSLTAQEKKEGWQLLFNGTSKEGWHSYGKSEVGQAWQVVDGSLYFDTLQRQGRRIIGGGDMVTDKEYENFHLRLEWKAAPGTNSGIIFLVQEDPKKFSTTYLTGPEMQIIDNDRHADAKIHKHRAGDLYDLIASSKEVANPVGEWNLAEIKLNKGKLDLFLNGTPIVSTTMWDDNWNGLVDNSKFKTWKDFAKNKRGKIALQDHGNAVWFRNIRIKEL